MYGLEKLRIKGRVNIKRGREGGIINLSHRGGIRGGITAHTFSAFVGNFLPGFLPLIKLDLEVSQQTQTVGILTTVDRAS